MCVFRTQTHKNTSHHYFHTYSFKYIDTYVHIYLTSVCVSRLCVFVLEIDEGRGGGEKEEEMSTRVVYTSPLPSPSSFLSERSFLFLFHVKKKFFAISFLFAEKSE